MSAETQAAYTSTETTTDAETTPTNGNGNAADKEPATMADRARQALRDVQGETEKKMKELMDRGENYGKESFQSIKERIAPVTRLSENLLSRAKENAEWIQEKVEETVNRTLGTLHLPTPAELNRLRSTEWIQEKVEEAVNKTLSALHLPTPDEFNALKAAVEHLGKKVEALGTLSEVQTEVHETEGEISTVRGELDELRSTVDNLGKNLGLVEHKMRKLAQGKAAKRGRTGGAAEAAGA